MNHVIREIFKRVQPKLHPSLPTVVFPHPDHMRLCSPFRVIIEKLRHNNNLIHPLSSDDFDGVDLTREYGKKIGYHSHNGKMCYIFVNEFPILIDYFDQSHWKHSVAVRLYRHTRDSGIDRSDLVKAIIKFQFFDRGEYENLACKVYPFLYPGPNDYGSVSGMRTGDRWLNESDKNRYRSQFQKCVKASSFTYSVFARWKAFLLRRAAIDICKDIPDSLVTQERAPFPQYMDEMSNSRFSLVIRGNGKWTHREMETCSIGVPMLKISDTERMWKPFEPDVHFIDINIDNFKEKLEYYTNHYSEALEIADRGRQYYDDHYGQLGIQKIFREIVDVILKS